MKKTIYGLAVLMLALSLFSCGDSKKNGTSDPEKEPDASPTAEEPKESVASQVKIFCSCQYRIKKTVGGRGASPVSQTALSVSGEGADEETAEKSALDKCRALVKERFKNDSGFVTGCSVPEEE